MKNHCLLAFIVAASSALLLGQGEPKSAHGDISDCPMHAQHMAAGRHDHNFAPDGKQGMGFAQDKTTHHFLLSKDGGIIQVTANSADDKDSVSQIRMHLAHIRQAFASGDFNIPMFVHDQTPPGVLTMTRLRDQLHYKYEAIEKGGRLVISSENHEALSALHDFLRFQIREHKTGDPSEGK
jgi:hypothetical protein